RSTPERKSATASSDGPLQSEKSSLSLRENGRSRRTPDARSIPAAGAGSGGLPAESSASAKAAASATAAAQEAQARTCSAASAASTGSAPEASASASIGSRGRRQAFKLFLPTTCPSIRLWRERVCS